MVDKIDRPLPPDYPQPDYQRAYQSVTEGVPLKGTFITPMKATEQRDAYDNHPAVSTNSDKVRNKFAKEEGKSFHIHFLRFVYVFIYGIIINPIQWAFDKGKGRICIDCTKSKDDIASANTHIPGPKDNKPDECPPVYYQYAFATYIQRLYRMRYTRPGKPIYQHADDIEAAFRQLLYHPELAIAFAYVFQEYLLIPVGQVFGSRSAPSFYCLLADVRQAIAATTTLTKNEQYNSLVKTCEIQTEEDTAVTDVPYDSHHPKLTDNDMICPNNMSFVDDNAIAAWMEEIYNTLNQSVESAFAVFGAQGSNRRGDCINMDKWETLVRETFMYLGFLINTHNMTIEWPYTKRKALYDTLKEILERPKPIHITPKEVAHVIGVVRSASQVAPYGTFLSFNLENNLYAKMKTGNSTKKMWWRTARVYLNTIAIATMHQLMDTLLEPEGSPLWARPIALFVERDWTRSTEGTSKATPSTIALT